MKKTIWRILTIMTAVLLLAGCTAANEREEQTQPEESTHQKEYTEQSEALYIESRTGHLVLLKDGPVSVTAEADLFAGLTTGDKIQITHGLVAETYPGQTTVYTCTKLADGTPEDIPAEVLDTLRDMGWIAVSEQEAIDIALTHIGNQVVPFKDVTAQWSADTETWTVTCEQGNERAVVVIAADGEVMQYEHLIFD